MLFLIINNIVLIISLPAAALCRDDEENAVDRWRQSNNAVTQLQNDIIFT